MSKVEKILDNAGFIFLLLFILSLFTSKGGMNIFGGLSLIAAVLYIIIKKDRSILSIKPFKVVMLVFIVGLFMSFFTVDGFRNGYNYFIKYVNPLLIIVVPLFIGTFKRKWICLIAFNISAVASFIMGYYNYFVLKNIYRTESFHDPGRWGDMLIFALFINLCFIIYYKRKTIKDEVLYKGIAVIVIINTIICLLLTNNRGTMLGIMIAAVALFAVIDIKKMVLLIVISLVLIQAPILNEVKSRIISIADSHENSNLVRVQKWKLGIDFFKESPVFGAGLVTFDTRIIKHYNNMSEEFKKENNQAISSGSGELHNSYLQILVENGIIYFVLYMIMLLYFIYYLFVKYINAKNNEKIILSAAVFGSSAFLISQLFHSDLYSFGGFIVYFMIGLGITTSKSGEEK